MGRPGSPFPFFFKIYESSVNLWVGCDSNSLFDVCMYPSSTSTLPPAGWIHCILPFFKCMLGCCGKMRHIYCTTSALSDTLHTYIHTYTFPGHGYQLQKKTKNKMKHIWTFTYFRIDLCICYVLLQRSHVVSFGLWCWGTNSCVWTKKF